MALKVPQNQKKVHFIDKSFKIAMTMPQKKIRHKDGLIKVFYSYCFVNIKVMSDVR